MRRFIIVLSIISLLAGGVSASSLDRAFGLALAEVEAGSDGGGSSALRDGDDYSRRKALLLSLLVPGLGQRYNGSRMREHIFLGLEGAIWTSFVVFKFQESHRTDDFEEWAEAFAEVPGGGKDEEFYRILTIYDDVDDYNTSVRIDARTLFPDDRAGQLNYESENSFGADKFFRWKNNTRRLDYRLIRNDARDSGQRADFALVAAVLNRLISAVEAARSGESESNLASRVAGHIQVLPPSEGEPAFLRFALSSPF